MSKIVASIDNKILKIGEFIGLSPKCCCKGCLCCGLKQLVFKTINPVCLENVTPIGNRRSINYEVQQDVGCPYSDSGKPPITALGLSPPGSAYSLSISRHISTGIYTISLSLYCNNTPDFVLQLRPDNPENITISSFGCVEGSSDLSLYSGFGEFVKGPVTIPNDNSKGCKLSIEFNYKRNPFAVRIKFRKVKL